MKKRTVDSVLKRRAESLAQEDECVDFEELKGFFSYMAERHNIWHRRFILKKPRPWTKDPILRDYNFTNVYRELDRNTQWLLTHVVHSPKYASVMSQVWGTIVFRYFNKPSLFEYMGGIPSFEEYDHAVFERKVLEYQSKFGRVFTDAYTINPPKYKDDIKKGLTRFYCNHIRVLHRRLPKMMERLEEMKKPEEFMKMMCELSCIANFLAYEVYCDLTYTDWFPFTDSDYVNPGPGALLGLRILYPRYKKWRSRNRAMSMIASLSTCSDSYFRHFGLSIPYWNGKHLGLRSIEHSLCEYAKYWKMRERIGKQRKRFSPREGNPNQMEFEAFLSKGQ